MEKQEQIKVNFRKADDGWHCYLERGTCTDFVPFPQFMKFFNALGDAAKLLNK